jgi:aryl-alcohol dehydrogenase-like predicted oxidoreductase
MRYRKLGGTGVEVSTQCLGTMMFGSMGNPDPEDCTRIIHAALDAGINFIDTADIYSGGDSERIVGRALHGKRDDVVLATKCFNPMGEERNHRGGSRRWILRAVEDSLRRLGTDYLDLYQVHRRDWDTDLDETLDALSMLVAQGKVRYLGSSSYPAECIVEAQWTAQRRNLQRFVCEQPQYSIFARAAEPAVLPTAQRYRMGVICWSPLAGGWLTGRYRREVGLPQGSRFGGDGLFARMGRLGTDQLEYRYDLVAELDAVAGAAGLTLTELGLGFVDAHPAVTSTIIGPRTMDQLTGLLGAADVVLDNATLDAVDKLVPPGTDVPGISHSVPNPAVRRANRRRGLQG